MFDGTAIPSGASVEYLPITAKGRSKTHQFGKKTLKGHFLEHVLRAEKIWSGDSLQADCTDLQELEAAPVHVKRVIRISLCQWNHHLQQEDDVEFERSVEKEGSSQDSWSMSGDFMYRHHEDPRVTLYEPDDKTFPVPLKHIDVMRQAETLIDYVPENTTNDIWTKTIC